MSTDLKKIKNKYVRRALVCLISSITIPYVFFMLLCLTITAPFICVGYDEVEASWSGIFKDDIPQWYRQVW
ncbi:hypothetical protein PP940_gp190 [Rhizobium phage RL2RES]|uniref:Uncharacterized protein n=1 Tax=Rhizobium phage RL2RES TaxID=103371 RepID=A0A6B9J6C3_9CAUD|nr:hypothetical protein PP940_gp190 [Rhizobium phage RL2RES]QGZ14325.1 hypothetical protein RL2RES_190 [Rhizobium phage RL2RES]